MSLMWKWPCSIKGRAAAGNNTVASGSANYVTWSFGDKTFVIGGRGANYISYESIVP